MAKLSELGGNFELASEGKHPATLIEFVDLGVQISKFGMSRQADMVFEIAGVRTEDDKPMLAYKRIFNQSTGSKNFKVIVRALTGLFDIRDVDTKDLLGKPCELSIEHVLTDDGSTFANVEVKAPRGKAALPTPETPMLHFSLMKSEFVVADFNNLSERRREKIKESQTYKDLVAGKGKDGKVVAIRKGKGSKAETEAEFVQDEIPF